MDSGSVQDYVRMRSSKRVVYTICYKVDVRGGYGNYKPKCYSK